MLVLLNTKLFLWPYCYTLKHVEVVSLHFCVLVRNVHFCILKTVHFLSLILKKQPPHQKKPNMD